MTDYLSRVTPAPDHLTMGVVVDVGPQRLATVSVEGQDEPTPCEILEPAEGVLLQLEVGDRVVVWRPDGASAGVVMGRVGARRAPRARHRASAAGQAPGAPDELVLEARKSLTLRVGDGSITIREDGRILIKGKDLVSHAERMNRIKGGAVAIN